MFLTYICCCCHRGCRTLGVPDTSGTSLLFRKPVRSLPVEPGRCLHSGFLSGFSGKCKELHLALVGEVGDFRVEDDASNWNKNIGIETLEQRFFLSRSQKQNMQRELRNRHFNSNHCFITHFSTEIEVKV